MTLLIVSLYILIGALAGLLGGLLGVSGGIIVVPALFYIFKALHFPADYLMHMAITTSLAAMTLNSLLSTWFHHLRHNVLWKIVLALLPGIVLGSYVGGLIATHLSSHLLKTIFAFFLIFIGLYLALFTKNVQHISHRNPPKGVFSLIGFVIASIANMLGIGGSIFTAPILMTLRVPDLKAIGTSAASGFFITLLGAIAYIHLSFHVHVVPASFGLLYLPAFATITCVSFLMTPWGVMLAHKLPGHILKRIFGFFLIGVGVLMFVR